MAPAAPRAMGTAPAQTTTRAQSDASHKASMEEPRCATKIADIETLPGVPDQIDYSHQPFDMERALHYENASVDDIYRRWDDIVKEEDFPALEAMVRGLLEADPRSDQQLNKALAPLRKKYKLGPRKSQLLHAYRGLVKRQEILPSWPLEEVLTTKASKSQSGVLVVTVLTSPYPSVNGEKPQPFSCKWNCYYCPNEPGQPRSYLRDEPAVLRANQNKFDAIMQFTERCATLAQNGHPVDKVELLVLGGTWASYPLDYREAFCRDLYYAANTFWDRDKRERKSLEDEITENETAKSKIVGLTLETRPDTIDIPELQRLRMYGCTRVQLGVQHVDDKILKKVNRGHGRKAVETSLQLLKDACFKVDVHLMPNLPGSDTTKDMAMFDAMLFDPLLQADQWKIYPCEVTPWTVIKDWFDKGKYVPYSEEALTQLLVDAKAKVHPWIRLNRVVRDIPSNYILGGVDAPNMREEIQAEMKRQGKVCRCIRCREVGDISGLNQIKNSKKGEFRTASQRGWDTKKGRDAFKKGGSKAAAKYKERSRASRDGVLARRASEKLAVRAVLTRRHYRASGGDEHFLSFETPDRATIFGFVRLRLSQRAGAGAFKSLEGCALIRELHVYGQLRPALTGKSFGGGAAQQHSGFGKRLMADAERLAKDAGFRKAAVISGIGTRDYYRKLGYVLVEDSVAGKAVGGFGGGFLVKPLPRPSFLWRGLLLYACVLLVAVEFFV